MTTWKQHDFDAGYAQAIKDVVEAISDCYVGSDFRDAADFIESRFSAPSPNADEVKRWERGPTEAAVRHAHRDCADDGGPDE